MQEPGSAPPPSPLVGGASCPTPPPPYHAHLAKPWAEQHQLGASRMELRIRCPSLASNRWAFKLFSLVLGGLGSILTFFWVVFHIFVLGETEGLDLRLQRYLDIGLGLVLFSSSLSLVYAGYSESKAWLVVFTSGSLAVLILYWSWAAYNKYVSVDQLSYYQQMERVGVVVSIVYILLLLPILLYYRILDRAEMMQRRSSQPPVEGWRLEEGPLALPQIGPAPPLQLK